MSEIDVQSIKSRFDLREFVERDLGVSPDEKNSHYSFFKSPFRSTERTSSFCVYDDHYYDYGDPGVHGDIVDYVQETRGLGFVEAIEYLTGEEFKKWEPRNIKPKPREPRKILNLSDIAKYEKGIDTLIPYLQSRAIPQSIVAQLHLGGVKKSEEYKTINGESIFFRGTRLVIPHLFDDKVYCLNMRRSDQDCEKWINEKMNMTKADAIHMIKMDMAQKLHKNIDDILDSQAWDCMFGHKYKKPYGMRDFIFGVDQIYAKLDTGERRYKKIPYVIMDEGELNAASAMSVGYRAIQFKAFNQVSITTILKHVGVVYVPVHNDPDQVKRDGTVFNPGMAYAQQVVKAFGNDRTRVRLIRIPAPHKDMNDMLISGELSRFLEQEYHLEGRQ